MFLFPWSYYGQHISDFEKIDFFGLTAIFGPLHKGLGRANLRFLHGRPWHHGSKNFKKWWEHKIFLESCKEISKLPGDIFWVFIRCVLFTSSVDTKLFML